MAAPTAIAVIGLSNRFPGDATGPEKLWEMLRNGQDAHSGFPEDRFNFEGWYHPDPQRQGCVSGLPSLEAAFADMLSKIFIRGGHFLKGDISRFDAPVRSYSLSSSNP